MPRNRAAWASKNPAKFSTWPFSLLLLLLSATTGAVLPGVPLATFGLSAFASCALVVLTTVAAGALLDSLPCFSCDDEDESESLEEEDEEPFFWKRSVPSSHSSAAPSSSARNLLDGPQPWTTTAFLPSS
jgi:hypothetical protein